MKAKTCKCDLFKTFFSNTESRAACKTLGLRCVPARQWIDAEALPAPIKRSKRVRRVLLWDAVLIHPDDVARALKRKFIREIDERLHKDWVMLIGRHLE
jgi:hypothetical protein